MIFDLYLPLAGIFKMERFFSKWKGDACGEKPYK